MNIRIQHYCESVNVIITEELKESATIYMDDKSLCDQKFNADASVSAPDQRFYNQRQHTASTDVGVLTKPEEADDDVSEDEVVVSGYQNVGIHTETEDADDDVSEDDVVAIDFVAENSVGNGSDFIICDGVDLAVERALRELIGSSGHISWRYSSAKSAQINELKAAASRGREAVRMLLMSSTKIKLDLLINRKEFDPFYSQVEGTGYCAFICAASVGLYASGRRERSSLPLRLNAQSLIRRSADRRDFIAYYTEIFFQEGMFFYQSRLAELLLSL